MKPAVRLIVFSIPVLVACGLLNIAHSDVEIQTTVDAIVQRTQTAEASDRELAPAPIIRLSLTPPTSSSSTLRCIETPTRKAYNNSESKGSAACPAGGYLYQSFLSSSESINSISISLKAGGSFPTNGFTTKLALRDCKVDGPIVATAEFKIPYQVLSTINATFIFPQTVQVTLGQRLVIQWFSPDPFEGVQFLSWRYSLENSYSDGYSITECVEGLVRQPDPERDYIFEVTNH